MTRIYLLLAYIAFVACSDISETIQPNTHDLPKTTEALEVLLNESEDVVKLQIYWKLYKGYRDADVSLSLDYLGELHKLAKEVGNNTFQGLAHYGKGMVYKNMGKYNLSIGEYLKAIDIFSNAKDWARAADTYNAIGTTFMRIGGYKHAITYFEKAIGYYKLSDGYHYVINSTINLAMCHAKSSNSSKSYELFENSIKYQIDFDPNNFGKLKLIYTKMGVAAFRASDYLKSVESYEAALNYADLEGNGQKDVLYNLAETYMRLGGSENYKTASLYLQQAQNLADPEPASTRIQTMRLNISGELQQREGNHIEALKTLEKAVSVSNKEVVNAPFQETLNLIEASHSALVNKGALVSAKTLLAYEAFEDKQASLKEELSKNMDNEGLVKALQKEIALHEEAKATLSASRTSDIALQATGLLFLFGLIGFVAYRKQSSSLAEMSIRLKDESNYSREAYIRLCKIADILDKVDVEQVAGEKTVKEKSTPLIPPPSMGSTGLE